MSKLLSLDAARYLDGVVQRCLAARSSCVRCLKHLLFITASSEQLALQGPRACSVPSTLRHQHRFTPAFKRFYSGYDLNQLERVTLEALTDECRAIFMVDPEEWTYEFLNGLAVKAVAMLKETDTQIVYEKIHPRQARIGLVDDSC
ncbi:hypothetical protein LTR17_024194 [Elasticomyces elasticus]|nr:hypothetical protein LTR17_024194 [Elasticomyces elasticus]